MNLLIVALAFASASAAHLLWCWQALRSRRLYQGRVAVGDVADVGLVAAGNTAAGLVVCAAVEVGRQPQKHMGVTDCCSLHSCALAGSRMRLVVREQREESQRLY